MSKYIEPDELAINCIICKENIPEIMTHIGPMCRECANKIEREDNIKKESAY